MKTWICLVCGWIYDEAKGDAKEGFAPGTAWADIPVDWACPDCGVGKEDFEMAEIKQPASAVLSAATELEIMDMEPVIIIGSGMAAYNLAKEIRKIDTKTPLMMISRDDGNFYIKPNLSNGLTGGKDPDDIILYSKKTVENTLNLTLKSYVEVTDIDVETQQITAGTEEFKYSKLIFATGASVIKGRFSGNATRDILSVNDLFDYRKYRVALVGKKDVVIIGAGLIGCEFANDLLNHGLNVQLIDQADSPMSGLLPQVAGDILKNTLEEKSVKFHLKSKVVSIDFQADNSGQDGFEITLDNGHIVKADVVLSAIGLKANITLAEKAGIKCDRAITVNKYLETSSSNIYAMGDCAAVEGHVLMYVEPLLLAAKTLAQTITGQRTAVSYRIMPVTVKTPICPTIIAAPLKTAVGEWEYLQKGNNLEALFRDEAGDIVGFALLGDATAEKKTLESALPKIF